MCSRLPSVAQSTQSGSCARYHLVNGADNAWWLFLACLGPGDDDESPPIGCRDCLWITCISGVRVDQPGCWPGKLSVVLRVNSPLCTGRCIRIAVEHQVFELILLAIALQGSLRRLAIRISIKNGFFHHTRQLFNFSLPTLLGQLVVNPVQTFMLSFLATQPNGLAQVGLITTGQRLSSLTAFLPGAMATTVMPILSTEWGRGDRASFQQGVLSALRMLWLSSLPGVVFFLPQPPPFSAYCTALNLWLPRLLQLHCLSCSYS